MIDVRRIAAFLTEACEEYEKTAPTVAAHCDDLYRRVTGDPAKVSLAELRQVATLVEDDGEWMHPSYAANAIYKLRSRLGMDTTGHIGF
jgi:hypothetical protein